MKTTLHFAAVIAAVLLFSVSSCSDSDEIPVRDVITMEDEAPEIIFSTGGPETQTINFHSATDWNLLNYQAEWVEITPSSGEGGDAEITVKLLQKETDKPRSLIVTIKAGIATGGFVVKQTTTPEDAVITNSQKKLKIGSVMNLNCEVTPQDASLVGIKWTSSDTSVASVDDKGNVTGIAVGTTTIKFETTGFSDSTDIEVVEDHTTDNHNKEYSFEMLASLSYGVTVEDEYYIINEDICIAENDVLVLKDGQNVKIRDGVEIKINGMADFSPENEVTIEPYDDSSKPKYIYFTGDNNAGGQIRNVTFIDCPIRYFGTADLFIDNCTSRDITTNTAAVNCSGTGTVTVTNSRFLDNNYPAIEAGANMASPVIFKNNYLYKNNSSGGNRPQINLTAAGNGKVEITGNEIIGHATNSNRGGGIAVSNLLGITGTNEVIIDDNKISDCRYGITTNGVVDARITDNILKNNNYDSNPMSGGSGISISNAAGGAKIYISGNYIEGHIWGITIIGTVGSGVGPYVNLGNLTEGQDYNPGLNVFKDNGNNGVLYDLYNNSPLDMYAEGNTWNVAVQDEASIETVIFHKNDDSTLGRVTFMPAAQ